MVMKDKLYKSGHKGIYYKTRKALIAGAVVLGVFTAVSVPTYINLKNSHQYKAEALKESLKVECEKRDVKATKETVISNLQNFAEDEEINDKWCVSVNAK